MAGERPLARDWTSWATHRYENPYRHRTHQIKKTGLCWNILDFWLKVNPLRVRTGIDWLNLSSIGLGWTGSWIYVFHPENWCCQKHTRFSPIATKIHMHVNGSTLNMFVWQNVPIVIVPPTGNKKWLSFFFILMHCYQFINLIRL